MAQFVSQRNGVWQTIDITAGRDEPLVFDFLAGFLKRRNPVARLRVLFDGFKPFLCGDEISLVFGEFEQFFEPALFHERGDSG